MLISESIPGESTKEVESIQEMHKAVVEDFNALTTENRWEEYDHSKIFIFTPAGLRGKSKVLVLHL